MFIIYSQPIFSWIGFSSQFISYEYWSQMHEPDNEYDCAIIIIIK